MISHPAPPSSFWHDACVCVDGHIHQPPTDNQPPRAIHIDGPVPCPECAPEAHAAWLQTLQPAENDEPAEDAG